MKKSFIILFLLIFTLNVNATHNRAGEINYTQIGPLTFEITLVTYTDPTTIAHQQRTELYFYFSDNTQDTFPRVSETLIDINISRNEYFGIHTFPSPGTYIISMEDPNRNSGIINIPNSVNISFYLESIIMINPLIGNNSAPVLLNSPIDNAVVGIPFIHNPSAFDIDGDSLSYSIISCKGESGNPINGYQFPEASNSLNIDENGTLIWDSPKLVGNYNIAILIEEWRGKVKVGSIIRDMQITVAPNNLNNTPPKIDIQNNICVIAGDSFNIPILAWDEDSIFIDNIGTYYWGSINIPIGTIIVDTTFQRIKLSGTSGLFSFNQQTDTQTISTNLNVPVYCSDVRKNPHQLVVKVKENSYSTVPLSSMQTLKIKVIAPKVENLKVDSIIQKQKTISISWDPNICSNVSSYIIYRKDGVSSLKLDSCITGIPNNSDFEMIGEVFGHSTNNYYDNGNNLIEGVSYCYRIVAKFPDGAKSIVSNEVCAEFLNTSPLITNISVNHPDSTNGMYIAWSKPKDIIYSTNSYYKVLRSVDGQNFNAIHNTIGIDDTTFIDNLIIANEKQYFYKIELIDNGLLVGESIGSSYWLTLFPEDNSIMINIENSNNWQDTAFIIFRKDQNSTKFDSITTINDNLYQDLGLKNGTNYCYYIKSIGMYSGSKTITPIFNLSNNMCETPIDSTPPCPPNLTLLEDCKNSSISIFLEGDSLCMEDTEVYTLYLLNNGNRRYISNIDSIYFFYKNLNTIAGCYVVTATDSFGNESQISNQLCIDNCPEYELPNVFSPNNDNVNDFFIPIKNKHIESIELKIFSRWGKLVFISNDKDINWNGTKSGSQKNCADGVYFYVCKVNTIRLEGIQSYQLKGTISIIRGDTKKNH